MLVRPQLVSGNGFEFRIESILLAFCSGSETFNLESGDAVYFDSGVRHSYHRASKSPCTGVIVTA
jgi:mannose-6-phosphate isomerase-like protein (cupin superfamily)